MITKRNKQNTKGHTHTFIRLDHLSAQKVVKTVFWLHIYSQCTTDITAYSNNNDLLLKWGCVTNLTDIDFKKTATMCFATVTTDDSALLYAHHCNLQVPFPRSFGALHSQLITDNSN